MRIDKYLALLYGILLGDGSIGMYKCKGYQNKFNYNITITCNLLDDWPFINEIVLPLLKRLTSRDIRPRDKSHNNTIRINFCNKNLFFFLRELDFPVGKKADKPYIPKIFYDKDLVKYVVQGFFATDGSLVLTKNPNKYYPRIESKTTHKILMKQIKDYLNELGMNGYFYDYKFKKVDTRWKTVRKQYRFQFNGKKNLILFSKLIGFVNPKQREKFERFLNYSREYDKLVERIHVRDQKIYRLNNLNGVPGI
ncbi:TPA: hypothetical protein HA278_03705 [Candidatus Woesearchaeota archaeon]|nr:hypothetical protein [Candidatus Woesearchaeota archaeon]|tara:strand:+ start:563 stop:1318 length:756 start_codon:yes stop_codon:yes gene_type:complete